MAFDRNNAADLTALKNEVTTDPASVGYAAVVNNTSELLALLNDPANNPGAETGADEITPRNLLKALFPVSVSSQDQFKVQLIFESAQNIDDDISIFRTDVSDLSTQLSNAVAGIVRSLSRAEVLFADVDANGSTESVRISRDDWIAARDS